MSCLNTKYLGLEVTSPIVVASCGLSKNLQSIKDAAAAGAGAIVLKSLFEEVLAENDSGLAESAANHPEAYEYFNVQLHLQYGADDYCQLISEAKKSINLPLIASINCISDKWWPDFALKIAAAGADALELNVYPYANSNSQVSSKEIEELHLQILKAVRKQLKIPIAMKISPYFSALSNFSNQLVGAGLDGLVIFNRFTEPDIDIDKLELKTTFSLSHSYEYNRILRWVAILAADKNCQISATTGIDSAATVIKMLLAGAQTVQLASVLYRHGLSVIEKFNQEISTWMKKHNFSTIEDFRGKLGFSAEGNQELFLRAQFMEKIRGIE